MAGTPYPIPYSEYPLPGLPTLPPLITDPNVQPPRPPNSWILYRAWKLKQLPPPGPGEPRRAQAEMSSLLSALWRTETVEIKEYFDRLADEAKAIHKLRYPNYRYQPKKKDENKPVRAPPKPKKVSKAIRGATAEVDAETAPVEQRAGHPYASSSRPIRNSDPRLPPSPPLSAAASPSIAPSTPDVFECPEFELQPSSSSVVAGDPSQSPTTSDTLPQTPAPELFDQASSPELADPASSAVDTPGWDFSESDTPYNLLDRLFQGSVWSPNQFVDMNMGEQPVLSYNIPATLNNLGAEDMLPCGHPQLGPHEPKCFMLPAGTQNVDHTQNEGRAELEVQLGTILGAVNPFGDVPAEFYSAHNPVFTVPDISLYPQDSTSLPFNLEQEFINNANTQELNNIFFPTTDPASVFYFSGEMAEGQPVVEAVDAPYMPPSGAAHSSTRRVGGTWSGFVRDMDFDIHAASQFEVHAS